MLVAMRAHPSLTLYCHDSLGLGHMRRAYLLAEHLRAHWPDMPQLIISGLSLSEPFFYAEWADYIKLPTALPIAFEELQARRRDILLSIVRHFQPDVLLVDHTPAGLQAELLPSLQYLKDQFPRTRLILGLRDIVEGGSRVRRFWTRDGVYELLDRFYDRILIYGEEDIYDVVRQASLSAQVAAKVRYVGYLRPRPARRPPEQVRSELGLESEPLVLVTVGGGGDGYDVLRTVLGALRLHSERLRFACVLVGGPLMPRADRDRLRELVPAGSSVRFLDFVEGLTDYIAAADLVVTRGGYNSICEIVSAGRPSIIIPRIAFGHEAIQEQVLRAEALSRRGLARMIHPHDLTPALLIKVIEESLESPGTPHNSLRMDGLALARAEIEGLLAEPAR
jgi:predicted glycosyltransferase